jgi:hypothetical protein
MLQYVLAVTSIIRSKTAIKAVQFFDPLNKVFKRSIRVK